jgi:hypothetical protein
MGTKLTLKLNGSVTESAKSHTTSLSEMIESDGVTKEKGEGHKSEITPLFKSLSGVINLPADFDYKKSK